MVGAGDAEFPEFPLEDKKQKKLKSELQQLEKQYESLKSDAERVALIRKFPKLSYSAL